MYGRVGEYFYAVAPVKHGPYGGEASVDPGIFRVQADFGAYLEGEIEGAGTFRQGDRLAFYRIYGHVFVVERVVYARNQFLRVVGKLLQDLRKSLHPLLLALHYAAEIGLFAHYVGGYVELLYIPVWVQQTEVYRTVAVCLRLRHIVHEAACLLAVAVAQHRIYL